MNTLFSSCLVCSSNSADLELSVPVEQESAASSKLFTYYKNEKKEWLPTGADGTCSREVSSADNVSHCKPSLGADDAGSELSTADCEGESSRSLETADLRAEDTDIFETKPVPTEPDAFAGEGTESEAPAASSTKDNQVEDLRQRLAELLASDEGARTTIECFGGHHSCFKRFLKSCKNNVDAAEKKLRNTFAFRESVGANSLLDDPAALKLYEDMRNVWPETVHGSLSDGSPVTYLSIKKAITFLKAGYSEDHIRRYWLVATEKTLRMQRQGRRDDSQCMPGNVVLYNLEGLSLWQLSSCTSGLQQFTRVISLAEEYYPLMMRKAVVTRVPGFFAKMIWPIVQKVLDAETSSNVCITSSGLESLTAAQLGFDPAELHQLASSAE